MQSAAIVFPKKGGYERVPPSHKIANIHLKHTFTQDTAKMGREWGNERKNTVPVCDLRREINIGKGLQL